MIGYYQLLCFVVHRFDIFEWKIPKFLQLALEIYRLSIDFQDELCALEKMLVVHCEIGDPNNLSCSTTRPLTSWEETTLFVTQNNCHGQMFFSHVVFLRIASKAPVRTQQNLYTAFEWI